MRGSLSALAWRLPWLAGATIGLGVGCVAIDPNATLCAVGEQGCSCTLGGGCDPGLVCEDEQCVDPQAAATDGADSGTRGSGTDADGDTDTDSNTSMPGESEDDPEPAAPNLAFVTSTQYTAGDIGGLAGADAKCQQHADAAALDGTFVAWLSLPGQDARDRIGQVSGWVRPDGLPVAGDKQQLVDGHFYYPALLDENGSDATPAFIWTGTLDGGTADTFDDCDGWSANASDGFAVVGELGAGSGWWTNYSILACNEQGRLMCLGVDHQWDLTVQPTEGRLVFVSNGLLPPTAGRAGADMMCQNEANGAGRDGTFLALLAVNGEAPADRFDIGGPAWVRADGIPVFRQGDPFGPTLATPLLYDAMGNPSSLAIGWAGAYGVFEAGSNETNCTNWTATTGLAGMFNLFHISWQGWALGGGSDECAQVGYSVVCLEQ